MALLMYATVQGDREQWFWGLVWASESGAVKCSTLAASPAAPYTASDPLFFSHLHCLTNLCFLEEGGVGFLGEEEGNNHTFSLTAD